MYQISLLPISILTGWRLTLLRLGSCSGPTSRSHTDHTDHATRLVLQTHPLHTALEILRFQRFAMTLVDTLPNTCPTSLLFFIAYLQRYAASPTQLRLPNDLQPYALFQTAFILSCKVYSDTEVAICTWTKDGCFEARELIRMEVQLLSILAYEVCLFGDAFEKLHWKLVSELLNRGETEDRQRLEAKPVTNDSGYATLKR
ncbi:hypothetical protein BC830DRAFT_1106018 [Chytriomyces sp. MP71]|nr:hypothetical protein BC830DRAFT_1106018 [Chytriomyces sp. MP71]